MPVKQDLKSRFLLSLSHSSPSKAETSLGILFRHFITLGRRLSNDELSFWKLSLSSTDRLPEPSVENLASLYQLRQHLTFL